MGPPRGGAATVVDLGPLRAVPFGQGYKADTIVGGRGSTDIRVVDTTSGGTGSGSLRAAMQDAPLTNYIVLFSTSGVCALPENVFQHSFTTVDFGSAPSPGFTLQRAAGDTDTNRGCLYNINGNQEDMIVSHLRLRDRNDLTNPNNQSLLFVGTQDPDHGYGSTPGALRVFIDHLSTAWGGDEHAFVDNNCEDVTFWLSFIGPTAHAGRASLIHGGATPSTVKRLAYMRCAWILNPDRSVEAKVGTNWLEYNNYKYACGHNAGAGTDCGDGIHSIVSGTGEAGAITRLSLRNNVYEGNATYDLPQQEFDQAGGDFGHQRYVNGNVGMISCVESPCVVEDVANEADLDMGLPEVATVLDGSAVKAHVLANAGARINDRDFVDQDAIDDAEAGTGTQLSGQPPSLYTLDVETLACDYPLNHADLIPGGGGWTYMDLWLRNRKIATGAMAA